MLNRQKSLLALLRHAGGSASRTQLTKWAFLLAHESPGGGGNAFFDFVPYKYGPFSFALYQEVAKLVEQGLIREGDAKIWSVTDAGREILAKAGGEWAADVRWVLRQYGKWGADELTGHVYERYPWFTINSELDRREPRPVGPPAVYTAGYERLSVDAFLDGLLKAGIRSLIDVRRNPVSRRFGFHGSTLRRLGGHLGVDYLHFPELGVASSEREGLSGFASYQALLARYEADLRSAQPPELSAVSKLVAGGPSVLVCMEADPAWCHRSRLAEAVAEQTGLPVRHLRFAA